jgi:LmbE family N-acetylglucosaminyl deacetylase
MRLDFHQERVLAVVAHPDDAELLCAGTLARAKADGAAVAVCVMCRGDKGRPAGDVKDAAAVRKREMTAAAKVLGADLFRGGIPDGELADVPAQRRKLIQVYRRYRPTLVLAHWMHDYHPDHRAAGALAEAVSWMACSAGHRTRRPPLAKPPALWWMDTVNMAGFEPGFYVDVSEHVELKRRMLACHRSQLARAGEPDFAPLEETMLNLCSTRGAQAGAEAAEAFRAHTAWKRARAW